MLGMLTPTSGKGLLFHWTTDLMGLAITIAVILPLYLKRKAADAQATEKT